jgi:hypothetical protein
MTIKEIAGKILLIIYVIQREDPVGLQEEMIDIVTVVYSDDKRRVPYFREDTRLVKAMRAVDDNDASLYSAFHYLLDKELIGFLNKEKNKTMDGEYYFGIRLTDKGFDVIEGVEQSKESQKKFSSLFNITIAPTVKVDSLVKAEVGNIVGVGGAINI